MIFKDIFVYPKYPENLQHLYDLAYNMWSVWDYDAIGLFYRIDPILFRDVDHNPLKFLHSLPRERLKALSSDRGFLNELENLWQKFQDYMSQSETFKQQCEKECSLGLKDVIAYFSMEFGVHESIPIYAGGLGVLAGDMLKGASDLNIPIVGVGLLYRCGYFTQYIDINGYQQEVFKKFENHLISVREIHTSQGDWASITLRIRDEQIKIKLWELNVGKTRVILLDSDIDENPASMRDITNELYVGEREKRIQQEMILGIGGVKALDLLGIKPKIYHFNEGHSAFVIIGRLDELIRGKGMSFSEAKAIIRASTVFTTHTPVIDGNENLPTELVKKYLQPKLEQLQLNFDDIAKEGFIDGKTGTFWMPAFAMRFSRNTNAVSKQHAEVSKKLWSQLFPQKPAVEIPIMPITNGVHRSWISPGFTNMLNRYLGPDFAHCSRNTEIWRNIYNIPDEELWEEHRKNKKDLVSFIRRQFSGGASSRRYKPARMLDFSKSFNSEYMTVVFARRFAAYKRPTLILKDKERLHKILTDTERPVQMIFAGKAHPADNYGKEMIKEVIDFARKYQVENKLVFMENYDLNIARHLIWGSDVWLNNPCNGLEACGTSGMKAAMNGVLHLSTLEGWWVEGYNGKNGWAVTAGAGYEQPELQESADANQLYDLLEYEISVLYYDRNEANVPEAWVRIMKDSLFSICQNFNINRTLCDYLKQCYIPSLQYIERISANNYDILKTSLQQEKETLKNWSEIKISSFQTNVERKERVVKGDIVEVQCDVTFGRANAELFCVELFYMLDNNSRYKIIPMQLQPNTSVSSRYKCSFEIEGYGLQSINVRVKPANDIIEDLHPELVKWG